MSNQDVYLDTGLTQIETVKILVDKIKPSVEYLTYNIKRYKVPVALVLFYTTEDISESIEETMRLTDVLVTTKLGDAHFSFVLLPFTESIDSYSFIKHEIRRKLGNVENYYHFEELKPEVHNYFNFVNSYLFEIKERNTTKV